MASKKIDKLILKSTDYGSNLATNKPLDVKDFEGNFVFLADGINGVIDDLKDVNDKYEKVTYDINNKIIKESNSINDRLDSLSSTGLTNEPINIDLSEIKNEFINKGDVSISLGDTEINHVVAGFVSDGKNNIILTSDVSDIQVGDTITISGDVDETFNYNISSVGEKNSILLSENANIGRGDIITISGDTDETFSFDVNSIGSDSFNVPLGVNLNIGDTFSISGDSSGTEQTEIGNVEFSKGDFRIDNLNLGLVLNEGDVVTISGAKLGNTYDFTIQSAITKSIENGYRVYFSLSEETQKWNWLYADGLSITVSGTNGFDGTYTLNSDSSYTGFGNLQFYVDFPLTQIQRTHVSYLYNTIEANVNAPGGFLNYQGTIDWTTQTVVNIASINLPDPGRLAPSYQVGGSIVVSGTEEEVLSGDNGLLLTDTYTNLPKKSYTFRMELLSNSGWYIGNMGFAIQYPSGQPQTFDVNNGNGITTSDIIWSTEVDERGNTLYFGTFTLTALGQGSVDLLNNISLDGDLWTASLVVRKNSISDWNGALHQSRQDLGFYNDLGLTDFTNFYYISLFEIINQPYNLTGLQLNVTDSWGGSGEMDGSYEVVGRSSTYGHVIKAPKNFVLDETNGTPGLGSFNWSITVPSSDGTYEILSLNDKQDNNWLLVDGVIRHHHYGSGYLFPEMYEWQSHIGRVSYTFQDYVYPNFNNIEIIDDNGWFKWSSATSTVGGASMTVPTANGDYTIKTCDSGYITFNEVFRDNFSDNLSTLMTYPVNSNDGTYTVSDLVILKGEITYKNIIVSEPLVSKRDVTGVTISYTLASNNGTYTVTDTSLNLEDGSFTVFVEGTLKSKEGNGEILSYTLGSNNGTYTVSQVLSDTEFINYSGTYTGIYVEEPLVDKVADGNELATWIKSTRVEFSWIHAVLECGIVIWEAYDNDSNENNNGYWIAMKQDGQGEWIPVDAVKMTESFWNNWYDYTVKDPSNPRSVKLVGYDWTNGGSNPWSYNDYKPKFYHCQLSMNESLTELTVTESFVSASDSTWINAIASKLGVSSEVVSIGQIQMPWWDSNDDWYGMMWGERMGWIWFDVVVNGYRNIVGLNMLTGEMQPYNSANLNPFGSSYELGSNLGSHPKFGLLFFLYNNQNQYIYSPNFSEQKLTKINQPIEYGSVWDFNSWTQGMSWDCTSKFIYVSKYNSYNYETNYTIMRIDIQSGEVEYGVIKDSDFRLDPLIKYFYSPEWSNYYLENMGQWTWTKHNGWISSIVRWGEHSSHSRNYVVWRDEDKKPKLVKGYGYPTNFTSNTMFNADFVWKLPAIVSSTSTYKNNTF